MQRQVFAGDLDAAQEKLSALRETARLAATAMSLSEIARQLCVSEGTVKNRLTVVYDKLGIRGRNKRLTLAKRLKAAPLPGETEKS